MKTPCQLAAHLRVRIAGLTIVASTTILSLHLEYCQMTTRLSACPPSTRKTNTFFDDPPPALPEVNALEIYRNGCSSEDRQRTLSLFTSLGHSRLRDMLIEALADDDAAVRRLALESGYALSLEDRITLYEAGIRSGDRDLRALTWRMLEWYPKEKRVPVYAMALTQGDTIILEEALGQMQRLRDKACFELMLQLARRDSTWRGHRLLKELRLWLESSTQNLPTFRTAAELGSWWSAFQGLYDESLARRDTPKPAQPELEGKSRLGR